MRKLFATSCLAILGIFISVFGVLQFAQAAAATLYLSPASGSVGQGNNITIGVRVDTGGENVNAVQANLSYPDDKFEYISITNSSTFPLEVESSGGGGSVRIARGNFSGVTGDQLVASVIFKARTTTGTAAVSFAGGSAITRSSDSANILSGTTGGSYSVTAPAATPSPTPTPSPSPSGSSSSSSSSTKKTSGSSSSSSSSASTAAPSAAVSADKKAPTISDVKAIDISYKTATITWITSEPATSIVEYGVTANHGISAIDGSFVTNHKVVLPPEGLASGYQFSFMVKSVDPAGNTVTSNNATFTTKGLTLEVNVIDQKGKGVKGAKVSLGSRTAVSDKQGVAKLTELPAGKHELKVQFGGKTKGASVSILDDQNAKPQTTTVKIATSGLPMYVKIPIILGIIVLLAVVGVFAARFMRNRSGGGGSGPIASEPTQPTSEVPPINKVNSLPPATVVRPTEVNGPNQPQLPT